MLNTWDRANIIKIIPTWLRASLLGFHQTALALAKWVRIKYILLIQKTPPLTYTKIDIRETTKNIFPFFYVEQFLSFLLSTN